MKREEAEAIYVAAQRMSNWLYNVGQQADHAQYSADMREMVMGWDAAKSPLAKLTVPPTKRKHGGSK